MAQEQDGWQEYPRKSVFSALALTRVVGTSQILTEGKSGAHLLFQGLLQLLLPPLPQFL